MDFENVTIKTLANITGFSTTTVSRVLNGTYRKYRVSEKTAIIIHAEAKKLGYIPNQAAVNLRLKKNQSIGLIVPSLANPFFSTIASIISKAFYNRDYSVYMIDCDENQEIEKETINKISAQNMDGLIVIPSGNEYSHLERIISIKLPTIFIDRYFEDLPLPFVSTDHFQGALSAVELLVKKGHQKIACIQGNPTVVSSTERVKGYRAGIQKYGLGYEHIGGQEFTQEAGYEEMQRILQLEDRPTAVFALSDTISLGILQALKEQGYRIPEDFSLVSFDNSLYLDYLECPITSIAHPVEEIAEKAVNMLLAHMEDNTVAQKSTLFAPTLIERSSIRIL
ncbi:MAG TPA: LacI family DNA-binding transcriptional regulator [Sphingobacterium sp.]|nr:LacI family DNA-binding transcriptional regulator [Sphingobacterium sp.]